MKIHYIIFGLILFLISINMACKSTGNSIEQVYDEDLAKENPEYYTELKKVLSEFQNHLIENGILENSDNKSYIKLLRKIKKESKKDFEIGYHFNDSLKKINVLKKNEGLSMEGRAKIFRHSNPKDLKRYLSFYNIDNTPNGELKDALFAKKLLNFYNQKDYDLPIARVKLFKFIDPDSEGVTYIYVGKPTKE